MKTVTLPLCLRYVRVALSDKVLCLTYFSADHLLVHPDMLLMCPAAETDGGAAGGGVWRQAESVAWQKRAGVQTAQHPGPGTSFSLPLVSVSAATCFDWEVLLSLERCDRFWNKTALSFRWARRMWTQRRGWRKIWREPKSFWLMHRLCWITWRVMPPARGRSPSSKIKYATLINNLNP